jgi:hypothetical protein
MSVDEFLTNRFADSPPELRYYTRLWQAYQASGLADPHFTREIMRGDDGQFWSRVWEMVLYRHIAGLTSKISSAPAGPDFRAVIGGTPVYIEAITPDPSGLPADWLKLPEPGKIRVRTYPHEAMLLRWTAALKEKRDQFDRHRKSGLVEDGVPTVVAVNSCRLSPWPEVIGITQWPFAVEAVFPVGPLAIPVDVTTGEFGQSYQSVRLSVTNRNGSQVPTDSFVNAAYAGVSAVLGCATCYVENARHSVAKATRLDPARRVVSGSISGVGNVRVEEELKRKRAELIGEVEELAHRIETIRKQVAAIDQVIAIYDPAHTTPSATTAARKRPGKRLLFQSYWSNSTRPRRSLRCSVRLASRYPRPTARAGLPRSTE